ncbi:MAG: DNA polymerase III subunit gamma/tau [Candidatus Babeliales bacterium]|nr:DNA polymerase III subunit gamma/tau [Candidatus Babeliales bacterium]
MNTENLNLARKLRPKNFDQIVGQDLCVRILKNGLYLNTFFPVYLFSGQRGCGKTTSARVFAAAINCQKLADFQKNPKQAIPCYECNSCEFMVAGKHPDFIEIDAASHTGVDNVRQIIESSSFMPLMGRKKIYLIDEAHMLSKAAFNAFLKILEEPPATVLFILATTDVQRIIETVRSRCFQIFFSSIPEVDLVNYLEEICKNESINYEIDGLKIIVKESQGSARDAINLLEQVKFSSSVITKPVVLNVLGHISDENLLNILQCVVLQKSPQEFITFLDETKFSSFSPEYIFNRLNEILNIAIRMKFGVNSKLESARDIQKVSKDFPNDRLLFIVEEFFKAESLFLKTINKHLYLELLLLRLLTMETKKTVISKPSGSVDSRPIPNQTNKVATSSVQTQSTYNGLGTKKKLDEIKTEEIKISQVEDVAPVIEVTRETNEWDKFLQEIKTYNDPILNSIFSQAKYQNYDIENSKVIVTLGQNFTFFKDIINDNIGIWTPILNKVYGKQISLELNFDKSATATQPVQAKQVSENFIEKPIIKNFDKQQGSLGNKIDVSDKSKWQSANMLLDSFPGTIEEIQDEQ